MDSKRPSRNMVADVPRESVRVFTADGIRWLPLTEDERHVVGLHWNAIRRFLQEADTSRLDALAEGLDSPAVGVGGDRLAFDLDRIEEIAAHGDVRFESIYEG